MKTTVLLFCSILIFGFQSVKASGIKFSTDKTWKEVLAQAKKERKLVFLDAYASWCGPCKYLQTKVFTTDEVGSFYNNAFINVKMDMEEGEGIELSEKLSVSSYPTLFFINGDGEVVHKKVGAMEANEFLGLGSDALNPEKQFYTIKKKALQGAISPAQMNRWITAAEEMEDADIDDAIAGFLAHTKAPLLEKSMLQILLEHATLNADQLDFLIKNESACLAITGSTPEQFRSDLLRQTVRMATHLSLQEEVVDFAKFQKTVQTYFPKDAERETKKLKVRYYDYKEETAKSLDELADLISNPAFGLSASDLSGMLIKYAKSIKAQNRVNEFIQKTSQYRLSSADKDQGYQKDLGLLALYIVHEDKTNIAAYANRIMADANAPTDIKEMVQSYAVSK